MTGLFKIGNNHFFGVGIGLITGFAHQVCGPKAQQLVAAGFGLELHLFVVGIFVFKSGFAVVKGAHRCFPGVSVTIPFDMQLCVGLRKTPRTVLRQCSP